MELAQEKINAILRLKNEQGMSIRDIAQKLQIGKHIIEGVLQSVRKNADNAQDSPTDKVSDSYKDKTTSHETEKLRLQLAILEKNKAIEELKYKQIHAEQETIRMKNNAEIAILKTKADTDLLIQKQNQQKLDAGNKERKKAVKTLQTKINEFLEIFVECEVDADNDCEQEQADEYLSEIKKLKKELVKLFGDYDYKDFWHYRALKMLENEFDREFESSFFGRSSNYFCLEQDNLDLLENCLAEGVELGDTETNEEED